MTNEKELEKMTWKELMEHMKQIQIVFRRKHKKKMEFSLQSIDFGGT